MTMDELLGKSSSELAAMSDAEYENYFKQFYPVTRPEYAHKEKTSVMKQGRYINQEELAFKEKFKEAERLAASFGIKLKI